MPSPKLKNILKQATAFLSGAAHTASSRPARRIIGIFGSWWRAIAVFLALVMFLYYPLGGWLIEDINTDTAVEISPTDENQSATAEMMSYLIRSEVNDKIWTPNLPFFFPSYFLDNMPNFQLGLMSGVSALSKSMAARLEKNITLPEEHYLRMASELLQYPGTIWMFSPQNKLVPVPSAHSQYRKARKQLIKYNRKLNDGSLVFYRNPRDLAFFLRRMSTSLHQTAVRLEERIREESPSWLDTKADDIFYYGRGQAYANCMLLKALALDYKKILVDSGVYPDWTRMLKALENAAQMSPSIVRNGEIDSSFAPNHLTAQGFYLLKARSLMQKISRNLEKNVSPHKDSL